jgi:ABC-type branched-subunit amino acid transport system substrate-binding protein
MIGLRSLRWTAFLRRVSYVLSFAAAIVSHVSATPLTDTEARGKELYAHGEDRFGPEPKAFLGAESVPTPGRLATCASCHGDDGGGRPEGNIVPPDIAWAHLTKLQGHVHANGRAHPAFSDQTFADAIRLGLDPAGNRLDPVMPRYEFSHDQLAALVSYLKIIATDQAPGVGPDRISIAMVAPTKDSSAATGAARDMTLAYFSELNAQGGVYNRTIDLRIVEAGDAPEEAISRIGELMRGRDVFAVLGADISGFGAELSQLSERYSTPLIAPTSPFSHEGPKTNHYNFYVFSGVATQMRVLADYVAQNSDTPQPRVAVAYPETATLTDARRAIEERSQAHRWTAPILRSYPAGSFNAAATVADFVARDVNTVFFLGHSREFIDLLEAAKATQWRPRLLISGSTVPASIFDASDDLARQIFIAFPMQPDDMSKDAALRMLRRKYQLPAHYVASQIAAYFTAHLFVQGLKLSGRRLSPDRLLSALESLHGFEIGAAHQITFGANNHVGAFGAYVVGVEPATKRFKILSDWITPK